MRDEANRPLPVHHRQADDILHRLLPLVVLPNLRDSREPSAYGVALSALGVAASACAPGAPNACSRCIPCAIVSGRCVSAAWRGTRPALLIAFARERPWATTQTPLAPSTGAPPYSS